MLFVILLAILLIGALTVAVQQSANPEGASIDKEKLIIRASEVQRHASEIERGILYILQNGKSESVLRFAHPDAPADYGDLGADTDKSDQIFHRDGGGATYQDPPSDIQTAAGGSWEFYGATHLPGVGSNRPDLIALLPNVTQQFCARINDINDQSDAPADTGSGSASGSSAGDCIYQGDYARFDDGIQFFDSSPNTVDETSFAQDPETGNARTAMQACVICDNGTRHFYHVILSR